MSPSEPHDLRVELRRFLGGIPFSHEREITPDERRILRKEVIPYIGFGFLFLGLSLSAFLAIFLKTAVIVPTMLMLGVALAAVPICCYYWARPALQALRTGRLSVYLGRMSDIAAFDTVQAHYRGHPDIAAHLHHYVEILALGEGDQIWRFEGISNQEALAGVRPVWVATVPDHDERGERRLTEEEARELRLRASEFRKIGPFLVQEAVATIIALIFYAFTYGFPGPLAAWGGLIVWGLINVVVWLPYIRRCLFARMLKRDVRAGVVREGWLSSGMPWVVKGEPARWRTGRAVGGTNAVTKAQAIASENAAAEARQELSS